MQWLDEQREEGARVNESVVPEPDDDAVRVLTVHGSKGLEFPIVFLAGLGVGFRANPAALYHGEPEPELRLTTTSAGTYATVGYADRCEREEVADRHEGMRLLYVATTRARDHLVVSLHHHQGTSCHAAEIERVDAEHPLPWRVEDVDGPTQPPAAAVQLRWDDGAELSAMDADARDQWWRDRSAAIGGPARHRSSRPLPSPRRSGPSRRPATGPVRLLRLLRPAHPGRARRPSPRTTVPPGAAAGARRRSGVRSTRCCRPWTWPPASGSRARRGRRLWPRASPTGRTTIAAMVRSVLDAPTIRAAASQAAWREVPVAAVVDGISVEGFVDLLTATGDDLTVVDYKTDSARTDPEIDAAVERYRPQGAAYALALEQVLGRPVARCVFVFARAQGAAVEREVADLRDLVADVRDRLGSVASPGPTASSG